MSPYYEQILKHIDKLPDSAAIPYMTDREATQLGKRAAVARIKALAPERRTAIARHAVNARWAKARAAANSPK